MTTDAHTMDIGKTIQTIRRQKEISLPELSEKAGIDRGGLSRIENGKQSPTTKTLEKIAAALDTSVEQIYKTTTNITGTSEAPLATTIPLISSVQAGSFCEAIDNFHPGDAEEWLPCPVIVGPRAYALKVSGHSMTSPYPGERSYPDGCLIFVDPDKECANGSKVIAKLPDSNEVTFKKYVTEAGKTYLQPINPQFPVIEIDQETHICGVVVGSFWPE